MTFPFELIPQEGWLRDYLNYVAKFTASPQIYNFFVALTVFGTVMNRRVYMETGSRWLFPNLYIILLGRSGIMKSTAMHEGLRILRKHDMTLTYPDEMSPQMMKVIMKDRPRGLFPLDEMGNFLKEADKTYEGIKEFITKIYDCPPKYEKGLITGGLILIEKPFLSIIGTITPSGLNEYLTETDMRSGYWGRHLMIPAWENEEWIVWPPPADFLAQQLLVDYLQKIYIKAPTAMTPLAQAYDLYCGWDEYWRKLKKDIDPRFSPMYSRLPENIRKIAMIVQWSYEPTDYISEYSMKLAIDLINYLIFQYERISEEFGFSKHERDKNRLLRIMRDKGLDNNIARSVLLKYSHLSKREFDQAIDTMWEAHIIDKIEGKGMHYKICETIVKECE